MPGISVHAIDVTEAIPAKGMKVEIFKLEANCRSLIVKTTIGENGSLAASVDTAHRGVYEAVIYIGDYFRNKGLDLPDPAFIEIIPFQFGVADETQHYHLPLKFTPWGFSLFRGG